MSYQQAMRLARSGARVREENMNERWSVVYAAGSYWHVSTLGGQYEYQATAAQRESVRWSVMT